MNSYDEYISALRDRCQVADFAQAQRSLQVKLRKDDVYIVPFKRLARDLDALAHSECTECLHNPAFATQLTTVLCEWEPQIKRLDRIINVLAGLDERQRKEGLPVELRDQLHFIYQQMQWQDIPTSLDNIAPTEKIEEAETHTHPPVNLSPTPKEPTEDELAWQMVKSRNILEGYEAYLNREGEKRFEKAARQAILEIIEEDARLWAIASSTNTIAAYDEYITTTRAYKHVSEAHKRILDIHQETLDESSWESALLENSIEGYQRYLARPGSKKYFNEADTAMKTLLVRTSAGTKRCKACVTTYPSHYPVCMKCGCTEFDTIL